jgi:RNA polymerase sigma-70 factor (ECF subfamily)
MSTPPVTAAFADLLTIADPAGDVTPIEGRDAPQVRALVEAARAGSQAAFGELVTLYERVAFRTALTALRSREDAEDATQEAFVVAWQKLAGFRGDATFRTWILTIVWRKALDKRRARRLWWFRTARARAVTDVDPIDQLVALPADPERAAVARDLTRRVRDQVTRLSPKLRDTLLLTASGEHSYGEIAAMLAVPVGTVKWRVAEARRLLRHKLDDRRRA